MSLPEEIMPNTALLKVWQNWVLVALVLFLTGVVVHLIATHWMGANNQPEK